MKLSNRELDVLNLMKEGLINREIAKELNLDQKTVSTYALRIRNKLNVDSRYNGFYLVSKAIELGIIDLIQFQSMDEGEQCILKPTDLRPTDKTTSINTTSIPQKDFFGV